MSLELQFQSRNRGSCRFKTTISVVGMHDGRLFQSRNRGSCRFKSNQIITPILITEFQSRNRGSCRFKLPAKARGCDRCAMIVSIS